MGCRKAAGDVDALLLTAGEGGRRQVPQLLRDVQALEQAAGTRVRLVNGNTVGARRGGDDVERPDTRDGAQELADVADGGLAQLENAARAGAGDVHSLLTVAHQDAAAI